METDTDTQFAIVVNDEEQYSIWPAERQPFPLGWKPIGFQGDKAACLSRIDELWTDMRPLSLRQAMAKVGDTH